MKNNIFLGTILLEKNRWGSRIPSYKVSEWLECFKKDGFDGIELWENHVMKADITELNDLIEKASPVAVFNTYDEFTDETAEYRQKTAAVINQLKANAVKFNFGNDASKLEEYIKNLIEWTQLLPKDCILLCECHPNTVMEVPETAAKVFEQLKEERYQAIIHVFDKPDVIRPWFGNLGARITHAHVRVVDEDNNRVRLKFCSDTVKACLEVMQAAGFKGSFTIEFTEGVRTPGENIADLYSCALEDLVFLRDCLK